MKKRILEKLRVLEPTTCEVIDEGHLHKGHAGYGAGHWALTIKSELLTGSLVAQHRQIYHILSEEMAQIHALRITIL